MRRVLAAVLNSSLLAGLLLAGQPATAHAAADPPSSTYTSVSPVRVLDTRNGTGTGSTNPVGGGATITLDLSSRIPSTATAVVLNVTGVTPTANTFVSVFPGGTTRSSASSLNLAPGDIRPNQVTVSVGVSRTVSLYNNAGTVHLVADLTGYYATGAGAKFTPLSPNRILDTRQATALGAGTTRDVDLSEWIPASATAVTFNLTGTNPTAATFVTAFPTGASVPNASNLNLPPGDTRPNLVTVAVGANRRISLYNNTGSVDLIVDLAGFYTPDFGAVYLPQSPTRVLDTRTANAPVGPQTTRDLSFTATAPLTAVGVVLNLTGVDATAPTYVAAWAQAQPMPTYGSVLNLSAGQIVPNAAVVAFGANRGIQLYNNSGSVHLVADLAGVFAVLEPACTVDCLVAWGANSDRRLGTAQAVASSATPAPVPGLSGVRAVAAGGSNGAAYALLADGTVRAWGLNVNGQLGNGWRSYGAGGSAAPVPVVGLTGVTALSNSGRFALRADGTVWAWGSNYSGELGNGTYTSSTVPVRVTGLTDVIAIADTSGTVYALRANGTVWAWGGNSVGQLGSGSFALDSSVPVQVSGLTDVVTIGGGGGVGYAVRADGTAWAWGANNQGLLGNGQPCDPAAECVSRVPVRISGLTGVTAIVGSGNAYAVLDDGTVRAWGPSHSGRLGNGVECNPVSQTCESRVPVQVPNLTNVTGVADFASGGYALRTDGTVWGWGSGWLGALGTGVTTYSTVPVQIARLTGVSAMAGSFSAGYALVPSL